jgi:hypothetical protein
MRHIQRFVSTYLPHFCFLRIRVFLVVITSLDRPIKLGFALLRSLVLGGLHLLFPVMFDREELVEE